MRRFDADWLILAGAVAMCAVAAFAYAQDQDATTGGGDATYTYTGTDDGAADEHTMTGTCLPPDCTITVDGEWVLTSPTMCPHCWEEGTKVETHGIGEPWFNLVGVEIETIYGSYWYEYRCPNRHLYVVDE